MERKRIITIGVCITLLCIIGVMIFVFSPSNEGSNSIKENNAIKNTDEIDSDVNLDTGDEDIKWEDLKSSNLNLENTSVTITEGGVYTLTGNINDGSVTINSEGNVKLILDNISITNNSGPAIIVEAAENIVIELKDGSQNTLVDGDDYDNSEYDGCLFSRDDLILQGNGTLIITSNYLDGIVSNDDLKIVSGTYIIDSNDDAIRGKDSVYIVNGNFTLNSNGDAIKSTNDTDTEKGYVYIKNGRFTINSKGDGIQAETKLVIYDGTYKINTNGNITSTDQSSKGLKSVDNLMIENGTFELVTSDDAIHSNSYIGIKNGTINISSGDDGIHADTEIIIDGGTITIAKSYEGIESSDVTINGGDIKIISSDDGINISGGNDSSSMGGRPGQNNMSASSGILTINAGNIYVDASGDGLDANGSIVVNGGKIYVEGPTNNGNGALDYDATFNINGGTFVAVGSSGMAQGASTTSKQNYLFFNITASFDAKEISIKDSKGNEITSYTPSKSYSSVIISNDKIEADETYAVIIDGEEIGTVKPNASSAGFGGGGGHNAPTQQQRPARR